MDFWTVSLASAEMVGVLVSSFCSEAAGVRNVSSLIAGVSFSGAWITSFFVLDKGGSVAGVGVVLTSGGLSMAT